MCEVGRVSNRIVHIEESNAAREGGLPVSRPIDLNLCADEGSKQVGKQHGKLTFRIKTDVYRTNNPGRVGNRKYKTEEGREEMEEGTMMTLAHGSSVNRVFHMVDCFPPLFLNWDGFGLGSCPTRPCLSALTSILTMGEVKKDGVV